MSIGFLLDAFRRGGDAPALACPGGTATYRQLLARVEAWQARLAAEGIAAGRVASLEGDYSLETVAAFLALAGNGNIVVPLSRDSRVHADEFLDIAAVEYRLHPDRAAIEARPGSDADHELYGKLRERDAPGLVLFSSGSTGRHKAAVHDLSLLFRKFATPRHRYRSLVFLQADHIGGLNTLLYTLANGGLAVVPAERTPDAVAAAIARHRMELLPTSPTFLNLLLLSGAAERHDLSSLELITYGTEPMPESTLRRVAELFPKARLLQTYGMTEVGILRSQSRGNDSLWIWVGGEGYETKVVDGRLHIRADSAMLGYLNAPSPFDAEGFLDTGDRVESDGEWLRILGRESEIINVGGSKVYPAEVEDVLLQMENVADAVVSGEANALTGAIVAATVRLERPEPEVAFKLRMRQFCRERLAAYKIPARVRIATEELHSSRFKRLRR